MLYPIQSILDQSNPVHNITIQPMGEIIKTQILQSGHDQESQSHGTGE